MRRIALDIALAVALVLGLAFALLLGETPLSAAQYAQAFADPTSGPGEILWAIRAPRAAAAAVVGAALGVSGAVMQGLLRNPLADPGVLGVSAGAGLGAALAISLGLAAAPGGVEAASLVAALATGALLTVMAARLREPEGLILFGVALSAFGGALTSLVFNFSPSPVTIAEILSWLMGSVQNRGWSDVARQAPAMLAGAVLCAVSARGLLALTLGAETAAYSGLRIGLLRVAAVAGASLLTGGSVALAGVIGFVGLAAPHLVRAAAGSDPARLLMPAGLAGAVLLVLADLAVRVIPTDQELKLGVLTALVGAPLFALIAWRAARAWRA